MQSRYRNQNNSNVHENPSTGDGPVTMDGVLVIGGIAVEARSAWELWNAGYITLTRDQMASLPRLEL